ncbi:MAG TPA: SDR family oxidoreductase [Candidatus Margulisiibacteriota bacterium]|nr:SDR family oxidoreductase [Candidatus Margulisiibacteriota bacterium]
MTDLRGAVAVVTGGARRLGKSIALALAAHGSHVVINYRGSATEAAATAAAARSAGVRALSVCADVTHVADVDRLLEATLVEFGRLDVLVANAGAFERTPLTALTEAQWDAMLTNNLRATSLCAQRFGLHMHAHGGGCIVTLADVAGIRPWVDYLPYSVAKAGIITLTHALAKELAPSVRVNAIAPGPVLFPEDFDPAIRQREIERTLLKREGDPQNIADAALFLIRNDYVTGAVLPVDGGRLLT